MSKKTVSERRRDLKEKRAEDLYHIVASKMQQDGKGFCLDLYGVIVYDEDIRYLAGAIKRFTEEKGLPLVHLDIARSDLSGKTQGLAALATQLPHLEFLFLNKCELKNEDIIRLVRDLVGHPKLSLLNVDENYPIDPKYDAELITRFEEHNRLTKVMLPRCSDALRDRVEEITTRNELEAALDSSSESSLQSSDTGGGPWSDEEEEVEKTPSTSTQTINNGAEEPVAKKLKTVADHTAAYHAG